MRKRNKRIQLLVHYKPHHVSQNVIYRHFKPFLQDDREYVVVFYFDKEKRLFARAVINAGSYNVVTWRQADIMRLGLRLNAYSFVKCHNHPNTGKYWGDCLPSDADKRAHNYHKDCGKEMSLTMLDELIFSRNRFYSFRFNETYRCR